MRRENFSGLAYGNPLYAVPSRRDSRKRSPANSWLLQVHSVSRRRKRTLYMEPQDTGTRRAFRPKNGMERRNSPASFRSEV